MENYKEQIQKEALKQMADKIIELQKENEKLIQEIAIANKFIKSQKEYYEKLTNKNK